MIFTYKIETNLTEEELIKLGNDGWELISVSPITSGQSFYFKKVVSYNP